MFYYILKIDVILKLEVGVVEVLKGAKVITKCSVVMICLKRWRF